MEQPLLMLTTMSLIYTQGARYVEYDTVFAEGDEKKKALNLKKLLKLNDAACKLKIESFPEVVELTTKVFAAELFPLELAQYSNFMELTVEVNFHQEW